MNITNYKKFACFEYESVESSQIKLGDVVFKQEMYEGEDVSEIGIILQIHNENEFRTDKFGNCCMSEITIATREQVLMYRPDIIKDIDDSEELTTEQIVENLLSDMSAYKENIQEMLIKLINTEPKTKIYWDAWFRGAENLELENADRGEVFEK